MESFVRKHQKKINGTLGCFDRMLFRGYLPIQNGCAMAYFLNQNHIMFRNLKDFLTDSANRINKHTKAMADKRTIEFGLLDPFWKNRCIKSSNLRIEVFFKNNTLISISSRIFYRIMI